MGVRSFFRELFRQASIVETEPARQLVTTKRQRILDALVVAAANNKVVPPGTYKRIAEEVGARYNYVQRTAVKAGYSVADHGS